MDEEYTVMAKECLTFALISSCLLHTKHGQPNIGQPNISLHINFKLHFFLFYRDVTSRQLPNSTQGYMSYDNLNSRTLEIGVEEDETHALTP